MLLHLDIKCEHCHSEGWYVRELILKNPDVHAYSCFYCGFVFYA